MLELRDVLDSKLVEGCLMLLDSNHLSMSDLLFGDLDPLGVEVLPLRSVIEEDLKGVHHVENGLGTFHGKTAGLKFGNVVKSEFHKLTLVLGDSKTLGVGNQPLAVGDPVSSETWVVSWVIKENFSDFDHVDDMHGASHGGATFAHLTLVVSSELPKVSSVLLDSKLLGLFDLQLGESDPVVIEPSP